MANAFDTSRCDISAIPKITPIAPLCCDLESPPDIIIPPAITDTTLPPLPVAPPDVFEFMDVYSSQINWFMNQAFETFITNYATNININGNPFAPNITAGQCIDISSDSSTGALVISATIDIQGDSSFISISSSSCDSSSSDCCGFEIKFDCSPLVIVGSSGINVTGGCSSSWTITPNTSTVSVVTGVTCNGDGTISVTTASVKVIV